ncbi:MAG: hypothetical protein WCJ35_11600 [Planctomycetota bacterium]
MSTERCEIDLLRNEDARHWHSANFARPAFPAAYQPPIPVNLSGFSLHRDTRDGLPWL